MVGEQVQPAPKQAKAKVVPEGDYLIKLTQLQKKDTKAGNATYLDGTFEVIEGEYAGSKMYKKFYIDHPNFKCTWYSKKRAEELLKSTGVGTSDVNLGKDFSILESCVNKAIVGKVSINPGKNGFPDRNEIDNFISR